MWFKALLIGLFIGALFIGITLFAQPSTNDLSAVTGKLDKIIQNQQEMMQYLKFIKNKV